MTIDPGIKKRFLIRIVDDDVGVRTGLTFLLKCLGWSSVDYLSAEEFLQKDNMLIPGCILLDIRMPGMSGLALQQKLFSDGVQLPVVIITGYADVETAVRTLKRGAFDFLEKPIALSRLISSVKEALAKSPKEPKIGAAARPQYTRAEPAPIRTGVQAPIPAAPAPVQSQDKSGSAPVSQLLDQVDFCAPLREARDQFERIYFLNLLKRENNSITRVASFAGLERTHLYRKLKQLGIEVGKIGKAKE